MGEFSADWLALREAADHRSRSAALTATIVQRLAPGDVTPGGAPSVRLLDLGTGSGSNVRYLVPRLPARQQWCVVDRDVDLLRELTKRVSAWGLDCGGIISGDQKQFAVRAATFEWQFEPCVTDLAKLLNPDVAAAVFAPLFANRALVTASALLDLVSDRWIDALVAQCANVGAAVLFVLTYDGRMTCTPADVDDEYVRELVNRHQQSTKGFGKALGPLAHAYAVRSFETAGYEVHCEPSDWVLTADDAALQRPLIDGWADAAAEIAGKTAKGTERKTADARVRAWQQRRLAHLEAGQSQLMVGHQDLAAWPAGSAGPNLIPLA